MILFYLLISTFYLRAIIFQLFHFFLYKTIKRIKTSVLYAKKWFQYFFYFNTIAHGVSNHWELFTHGSNEENTKVPHYFRPVPLRFRFWQQNAIDFKHYDLIHMTKWKYTYIARDTTHGSISWPNTINGYWFIFPIWWCYKITYINPNKYNERNG